MPYVLQTLASIGLLLLLAGGTARYTPWGPGVRPPGAPGGQAETPYTDTLRHRRRS